MANFELELKVKELKSKGLNPNQISIALNISKNTTKYYYKKGESKQNTITTRLEHCILCNKELGHSQYKYCSSKCREKHKYELKKQKLKDVLLKCEECGEEFVPKSETTQKFCSKKCAVKNNTIIKICPDCKKEFKTRNKDKIFCSQKCFHNNSKKGHLDFVEELIKSHKGLIVPIEIYKGSDHEIKCKCLLCGKEMNRKARRYIGTYSYGCTCSKISKGESKIKQLLDKLMVIYEPQYTFDNLKGVGGKLLSYDFYLPKYNLLIEYQGEYHDGNVNNQPKSKLKKQQEHDKRKREYAELHNIYLLEIWYWDFDNIDEILKNKLHREIKVNI